MEPGAGPAEAGRRKLEVQGRSVWVYHPRRPATAAVLVLHGSYDEPLDVAEASQFERVAEEQAFLAVFPEMHTPGGEDWGYQDDVPFFTALVAVLRELGVAQDEVYVAGHSAGGSMALFLQNNMADAFRGAAAVEAGLSCEEQWEPTSAGAPTLVVWNRNDPILREYDASLPATLRMLRRHDSTQSGPSFARPVRCAESAREAELVLWGAVARTPPTAVLVWDSAEPTHEWPNSANVPGSFDAAAEAWEFFMLTRVARADGAAASLQLFA